MHFTFIPYNLDKIATRPEDELYIVFDLKTDSWEVRQQGKVSTSAKDLMKAFFEKKELIDLFGGVFY